MVGCRPQTEPASIVCVDTATHGVQPFAIFDIQGGREPPAAVAERAIDGLEISCKPALTQVQSDRQTSCLPVDTIVILAIIDAKVLTITDLGGSRRILLKQGRAVRLTIGDRPDVPEEAQLIRANDGFIKNGKAVAMFPVSGARRPDVI
jgi:hypothetical protein